MDAMSKFPRSIALAAFASPIMRSPLLIVRPRCTRRLSPTTFSVLETTRTTSSASTGPHLPTISNGVPVDLDLLGALRRAARRPEPSLPRVGLPQVTGSVLRGPALDRRQQTR